MGKQEYTFIYPVQILISLNRTIAENICSEIHSLIPAITTTSVNVSSRGNKLYLDPNQNDYADTVAAPYSVRPYKHITRGVNGSAFHL